MQRRTPSLPPPPSLSVGSGAAPPTPTSKAYAKAYSIPSINALGIDIPKLIGIVTLAVFLTILILPTTAGLIVVVFAMCAFGFAYSSKLHDEVLSLDTGTQEMRDVSEPIRIGAEG